MATSQAAEPILDIAHLGNIEILSPKPAESLDYFVNILGMENVHTEGNSVYLRGYGDYATSTVKLTAAKAPGVGCVSWRASSPQALERRAQAIQDSGLGIGWTNGEYGRGPAFRFNDPEGHIMEVYYEETAYEAPDNLKSKLKNLPQRYTGRGINVRRIDHLALLAKDVASNREFAQDLLGLKLREQVRFNDGQTEIGSWLSPNPVHHQMAYVTDVKGGTARVHHFGLWVDEQQDVLRAAEILMEAGIFIEAGPSKHNNSQGFYLYHYEPGGNRMEVYSGSYLVFAPDFKPVTWNEDERGTGVYWGAALPDSFLNYATPDVEATPEAAAAPKVPIFDTH